MAALPMVAYMHVDSDRNDKELIALMCRFEENPGDLDLVLAIAAKRKSQGQIMIARLWREYAEGIS